MYNDLFQIGNLIIHGYGFMIALGIFVGMSLCLIFAPKHNLSRDTYLDLMLCTIIGGFTGAKLLAVLVNLPLLLQGQMTLIEALSITVIYGGIIGAMISCAVYCKIKSVDFWAYADLSLPCISITQGIGRIGCFLAGCCYGVEYDGIGAITFTESQFAPNNISLFPTQILSSIFMISFGVISLYLCNKKKHSKGDFGTLYMMVYGFARTIIEYFRGDAERGFILGMSTSQFISIFFIAVGFAARLYLIKKRDEADGPTN